MLNNMENLVLFSIALMVVAVFLSGCVGQNLGEANTQQAATDACKDLCDSQLKSGTDLSNGPCLSNSVAEGWVCDVAHSPRQAVDNEPANQCDAYRAGTAKHFVEVDTSCELIKAI